MWLLTIGLILLLIVLGYTYLVWDFDYWKKRGVAGPKPLPFLGNYPSIVTQKQHMADDVDVIYRKYKKDNDFVGIFRMKSPQLLILSPKLIRRVLVGDFKHFHDNEMSLMVDEKTDFTFANNPFNLTGEKWKDRRAEISPALTISRIKTVYPVTRKICQNMQEYIAKQSRMAPKDGVDAKDLSLRYTSELVTDCVLGLNAESFTDKPTLILDKIKKLFEPTLILIFYTVIIGLVPSLVRFYKITFVPKPVANFFRDLMQKAIELRKTQADQHERVDVLNYMQQLKEKKNLSTDRMTAHVITFLLDGFETTAGAMAHCLYLLARTPEAQSKLREEIQKYQNEEGKIDFDTLIEMPYLDACIHESLRMFAPIFGAVKLCTEPIELTNKNGQSVKLQKGDTVALPFHSVMNDEEYYADAHEFKPERFLEENGGIKNYRDMGVFYPFGDGPRICLGMRFALAQAKAAIAEITQNFNIKLNPKTRRDNRLDPYHFISQLDGGIWLDFEALK